MLNNSVELEQYWAMLNIIIDYLNVFGHAVRIMFLDVGLEEHTEMLLGH
jgi:hypothetical protein